MENKLIEKLNEELNKLCMIYKYDSKEIMIGDDVEYFDSLVVEIDELRDKLNLLTSDDNYNNNLEFRRRKDRERIIKWSESDNTVFTNGFTN